MSRKGESGYKVIVSSEWLDEIEKALPKTDEDESLTRKYRWSSARGKVKIDIADWDKNQIKILATFLDKKVSGGDISAKMSRNVLQQWIDICDNPSGSTISRFENLPEGLKNYIATSEKRWVFEQIEDGNMVPWFVDGTFHSPSTPYSSASVSISLVAIKSGSGEKNGSKTVRIFHEEFNKKLTMGQFLELKGLHLETPARLKSYEAEIEKFMSICDDDGLQVNVRGKAFLSDGWSSSGFRNVEKSGRPAKMVVDPPERERGESSISCSFWDKSEEKLWELPIHPVLECFDLEEHSDYLVHINNTTLYKYDTKVGEKLVLPNDVKDFIEVLIEHSKNKFIDIVGGKEGGTILLLEGLPGTGKTLTAEVYSEVMERPLYKVQSSQLGINPAQVEEKLKEALQRAERWGAILLIDEADVYIHERGSNITQNAIVGVFLRVLEYYRGVLFMTTNRGATVDDAIVSRLTARFVYEKPDKGEQARLWRILADQNNMKISSEEIAGIVRNTPDLSGRDIKNLLKLAYVSEIKTGNPITLGSVMKVLKFRQSINK